MTTGHESPIRAGPTPKPAGSGTGTAGAPASAKRARAADPGLIGPGTGPNRPEQPEPARTGRDGPDDRYVDLREPPPP
ncbi:hypothetical protein [Streptomyces sp. MS1.AVA.4]|uniref:Uncharacterized protein n=1 Tax=Streptomyces pratisoli TaxID=3139917 RepID=A0ACC6QGU1_9ACTN